MKPAPVLGTQGLIGPSEEATRFLGTIQKQSISVKGGTGWTVQLAMDQGKPIYLFDIPSQSWYRSDHYYQVNENALCKKHELFFLIKIKN